MLNYYQIGGALCCSAEELPYPAAQPGQLGDGVLNYLVRREDLTRSRAGWKVNDLRTLAAPEDVAWLNGKAMPALERGLADGTVADAAEQGRLRAVNLAHPAWESLLAPAAPKKKQRLHLLALGDVGSTLLLGLRLMGADVLDSIGICDVNEKAAARWEFEINQIAFPWNYDALPPVDVVPMDKLMDCDVFVFVASKGIPPVGSGVKDVRMAQYENNKAIVSQYAKQAREAGFKGLSAW